VCVAGFSSMKNGGSFWGGVERWWNTGGAMQVAIASAIFIAAVGISLAAGKISAALKAKSTARANTNASVEAAKETYALGENMQDRVRPFAAREGYKVYDGMTNYAEYEAMYGKEAAEAAGLAHNKEWIAQKISEGAHFVDVGPRGPLPVSPNYRMELQMLKDYPHYSRWWID